MQSNSTVPHPSKQGFTMIELAAVIIVIAGIAALLLPSLQAARAAGDLTNCTSNMKQLQIAYDLYMGDHDNEFFKFKELLPDGKVKYYFGTEQNTTTPDGFRVLDKSQGLMAPYLGKSYDVNICPEMPYGDSNFRKKFSEPTSGYGINSYMLAESSDWNGSTVKSFAGIINPTQTMTWGDAIQINTFQHPASSINPMLEEWWYLTISETSPKFHFRHSKKYNSSFVDGSIRSFRASTLDPRCDGQVGLLESSGKDEWLCLRKKDIKALKAAKPDSDGT